MKTVLYAGRRHAQSGRGIRRKQPGTRVLRSMMMLFLALVWTAIAVLVPVQAESGTPDPSPAASESAEPVDPVEPTPAEPSPDASDAPAYSGSGEEDPPPQAEVSRITLQIYHLLPDGEGLMHAPDEVFLDIDLLPGQQEYDLDIPADPEGAMLEDENTWLHVKPSPAVVAEGETNRVSGISVLDFGQFNGSGGISSGDGTCCFYGDSGAARMVLLVEEAGGAPRTVRLRLYQPDFKGVLVTPDVSVGRWGEQITPLVQAFWPPEINTTGFCQVYAGAASVMLSLPAVDHSRIASVEVLNGIQPDATAERLGDNLYRCSLSNDPGGSTRYLLRTVDREGGVETAELLIDKCALNVFTGTEEGSDVFTVTAEWTWHASMPVNEPKALVMYYHYGVVEGGTGFIPLGAQTFDLPDPEPGSDVVRFALPGGRIGDHSPQTPNALRIFLISGAVDAGAETFGGVKFGGAGFAASLPNWVPVEPIPPMDPEPLPEGAPETVGISGHTPSLPHTAGIPLGFCLLGGVFLILAGLHATRTTGRGRQRGTRLGALLLAFMLISASAGPVHAADVVSVEVQEAVSDGTSVRVVGSSQGGWVIVQLWEDARLAAFVSVPVDESGHFFAEFPIAVEDLSGWKVRAVDYFGGPYVDSSLSLAEPPVDGPPPLPEPEPSQPSGETGSSSDAPASPASPPGGASAAATPSALPLLQGQADMAGGALEERVVATIPASGILRLDGLFNELPQTQEVTGRLDEGSAYHMLRVGETAAPSLVLQLPMAALADGIGNEQGLIVDSPLGTLHFDTGALAAIAGTRPSSGANPRLQLESVRGEDVPALILPPDRGGISQSVLDSTHPVVRISLRTDAGEVSRFGSGRVFVSVPYRLQPGEQPGRMVVYHIGDDGVVSLMPECRYANGFIHFTTDHFSMFAINHRDGAVPSSFENHWAREAVTWLAVRDVLDLEAGGMTPGQPISRGDFVKLLYRAGATADPSPGSPSAPSGGDRVDATALMSSLSDDVKDEALAQAVRWAADAGVVRGTESGHFMSGMPLTRGQMALILARYLTWTGRLSDPSDPLASLALGRAAGRLDEPDAAMPARGETAAVYMDVPDSAEEMPQSIRHLTSMGVFTGWQSHFRPQAACSWAEAATALYRLLALDLP